MKEDLNFHGNQFNLLATFFTCGYIVGQIPSQFLLTKRRFFQYNSCLRIRQATQCHTL
jgi:hypothetical protein